MCFDQGVRKRDAAAFVALEVTMHKRTADAQTDSDSDIAAGPYLAYRMMMYCAGPLFSVHASFDSAATLVGARTD